MTELDPFEVNEKYAAVLKKTAGAVVREAAELPYPKDVLKVLYRGLIERSAGNEQMHEAFKDAYLSLASFQDLTDEERRAVAAMSPQSLDQVSARPIEEQVKHVDSAIHEYSSLIERITAERQRLVDELKPVAP